MFLGGTLGKNSSGRRGVTKLKEFICLHVSKLNKTRAGVFAQKVKVYLRKWCPETEMSLCTKTWPFDAPTQSIQEKILNHGL